MTEVTLITPTSDRPAAFKLCERWMRRAIAAYGRPVQWIVADDGVTPAPCTMQQRHLRRLKAVRPAESFVSNLTIALQAAVGEKILFIEDDDWYSAEYLVSMIGTLDDADIAGEARARYYNLQTRTYKLMGNTEHASLCQTGIRRVLVPWMLQHLQMRRRTSIDVHMWRSGATSYRRRLAVQTRLSVGMKGLPGTSGLGHGHRMTRGLGRDLTGSVLAAWTNTDDAGVYLAINGE